MISCHKGILNRALLLGASALALTATPAFAQDADQTSDASTATSANRNAEIVVTAQFREQNLQDTPLAITAVDAALLEARSQDDIQAVARQAPSVTLTKMGGAYGDSLGASIRGIGQFDFNPAYEPGVGFYIDDVYYSSLTGANFDLLDLERVEILRGPQGTLTGRNSIGGAIKLFSKKPDAVTSGFAEASYGSRDRLELRAGANFPITDNLYARFSAVHKEQDGYVDQIDYGCAFPDNPQGIAPTVGSNGKSDGCVLNKLGNENYSGARGAIRWEPSPNIDLMVVADYQHSDRLSAAESAFISPNSAYNCGQYCTYASWFLNAAGESGDYYTGNRNEFNGWGVSGHADIKLADNLSLQSITAYREYTNKWGTDDDYTPDPTIAAGGINDLSFWSFSQELRLNGSFGDLVDYTIGGYYSDQRSVYFTQQDIRYFGPNPLQFVGNDPINADTKAAYATVIFHPMPDLNVTGGIRYTEEHKDYTFVRRNFEYEKAPIALGIDALDGLVSVYDGQKTDWRISVDYRFAPQLLTYATVSTGFKGGGVTARPFLPQHAIDGSFGPETVTAYEMGFKSDLFDRRVRFNVSAFYNDYKDIQLPLSDCSAYGGGPCAVRANAGDGEIWGVEAELFAEPVDGLQFDGSISLLDSKYTYISPAVGSSITMDDPIVTPKVQFSAGLQYEASLGARGSITPRVDVSYRGKEFLGHALDAVSTDYQYRPSYTLANARLTYRNEDRDLSLSLEVLNLFDKYYSTSRFVSVYAFTGTGYNTVGSPREWRLSLKKDF